MPEKHIESACKRVLTANVTENMHQAALIKWWAVWCKKKAYPEEALIHIPNEGKRSYVTGRILRGMGMRKGVPDLFLAVPSNGHAGLWIELKREKGKATPEQKAYCETLRGLGYAAQICYGWEEARSMIEAYLRPLE